MTNKYVSQVLYLHLQTTEIETLKNCEANKFSKTLIAIHVNVPQFGPSMPSFVHVFAVLLKPFINVLGGCFYVLLILMARSQWLNLAKFCDTAPLKMVLFKENGRGIINFEKCKDLAKVRNANLQTQTYPGLPSILGSRCHLLLSCLKAI